MLTHVPCSPGRASEKHMAPRKKQKRSGAKEAEDEEGERVATEHGAEASVQTLADVVALLGPHAEEDNEYDLVLRSVHVHQDLHYVQSAPDCRAYCPA